MDAMPVLDLDGAAAGAADLTHFLSSLPDIQERYKAMEPRVGQTPRDMIYREHSVTVHRYRRDTPATVKTPFLLVYSLVNRAYVMDLLEGESFVEALLQRGLDVYLMEWGEPNRGQSHLTLGYYVKHYLHRAVRRVLRHAGTDKLTLAGYCLGGTLALLYSALDRGERVANLITMVTPIDGEHEGVLSWWSRPENLDVDQLVDSFGNIPAEFFASSFPWLVPTANMKKLRALYDRHEDPEFLDSLLALHMWGQDNTSFPGEVYREVMKQGYQENTLMKNGGWCLDGEWARLEDVRMPVLNLAASYDHLSVPESVACLSPLVGSDDCTEKSLPTGHLGIAFGKDARNQHTPDYWDEIASWVKDRDVAVRGDRHECH